MNTAPAGVGIMTDKDDSPHKRAGERHWERLFALFDRKLRA